MRLCSLRVSQLENCLDDICVCWAGRGRWSGVFRFFTPYRPSFSFSSFPINFPFLFVLLVVFFPYFFFSLRSPLFFSSLIRLLPSSFFFPPLFFPFPFNVIQLLRRHFFLSLSLPFSILRCCSVSPRLFLAFPSTWSIFGFSLPPVVCM